MADVVWCDIAWNHGGTHSARRIRVFPTKQLSILRLLIRKFINIDIFFVFSIDLTFTAFGGAEYTYLPTETTFDDAQLICQAIDGSLAAPDTSMALEFLSNLVSRAENFWTGAIFTLYTVVRCSSLEVN